MHLHTLSFAAIGPFPGQHDINFAELGAGGIFLLEGPTGAGKSTIIDAIVFALYGKVASKGASEERLRSTHVGPEVESSVDLVFETGHGIYRILRRPAYDRPNKRGSGTVRQNMQVQLWRLNSPEALHSGEQLSTRADEVGAEVTRIVGLSREQFVQTIVLPQGEFANFLSAKPEERRGLLQRVFGTEIYERLQGELVEARKQAKQQLSEAESRIRSAVDNFTGAAGLTPEECEMLTGLVASGHTEELQLAVAQHLVHIDAAAAEATELATIATAKRAKTQLADHAAQALLESVSRRDNLVQRSRALDAGSEQHQSHVRQHESAIKAGQVTGYLTAADRAEQGLAAAKRDLTQAVDQIHWLDAAHLPSVQELEAEISQRQDRIASLKHAAILEKELPRRTADHTARSAKVATRRDARTALAATLEARPSERQLLDEQRTAAVRTADTLVARTELLTQAEAAHTSAKQAGDLSNKLAALEPKIVDARTAALNGETVLSQLRRARIDGIAGELAANLRPSEPCMVCGSNEHPAPAALDENHVSPEAITAVENTNRKLEQALTELVDLRSNLSAEHVRHLTAAGERTTEETQAAVTAAKTELALATTAQTEADTLTAALTEFDTATASEHTKLATEDTWLTTETANLQSLADAMDADRATIQQALDAVPLEAAPSSAERNAVTLIAELTQQISDLRVVIDCLSARKRALAETDRSSDDVTQALETHGFANANAAREAALTPQVQTKLSSDIKAYEAERTLVSSGLAEAAIVALPDGLTAEQAQLDNQQAHKVALEATARAEETNRVASDKAGIRTRSDATASTITEALTGSASLMHKLAPTLRIASLADASSTDNTHALTLGTYVLTRRFEEVLDAANSRLREMSSGRYELQRSIEKETHGGRRLGLALRVVDHNTASHRDPATLSGGETFYVSLCLALGLADIVTAEAGGVDLGTLFVDEGFGSLDPETLDLVMAELGKLRSGGRMVGVVSHVEAMKSTISDRVSVRRQPGGSSTLHVLAGTS